MNEIIYNWSFSDVKNRGITWYFLAISIVIGLTVWGIFTKQYGLSFVIVLVSGVMFFIENNSPDIVKVEISELGIKVSEVFYEFSNIEGYSFIYDKENAVLLKLFFKKKGIKVLNLRIDNQICLNLKNILPNFLQEEEKGELSSMEKIINFLRL